MKTICVYVDSSNQFNSIYLQTKLLVERIESIFNVSVRYINSNELSEYINHPDYLILWPYGHFNTRLLFRFSLKNVLFIYHNITPAKHFWTTEPHVGLLSVIGRLQIRRLRFSRAQWVSVSEYNATKLYELGIKEVKVCPNIVVKKEISTTKTEEPSILYVGRIVQNKNCLKMLNIMEETAMELGKKLHIYIVGKGKENTHYLKEFTKKAETLNQQSNIEIHWMKSLSDDQLTETFQKCWLYISLSKHEGFGLPACESVINGTPAIYLPCGGQESVLYNTGVYQDETIKDGIVELLNHEEKLSALLSQQKNIVERYTTPSIDEKIKETYEGYLE